jgi:hypothetical protein
MFSMSTSGPRSKCCPIKRKKNKEKKLKASSYLYVLFKNGAYYGINRVSIRLFGPCRQD